MANDSNKGLSLFDLVGIAVATVIGGVIFVKATVSEWPSLISPWIEKGVCVKEFRPEAALRGIPVSAKGMKTITLEANISKGDCHALVSGDDGITREFSWKANQGGHIPVPLNEQMKAQGLSVQGPALAASGP